MESVDRLSAISSSQESRKNPGRKVWIKDVRGHEFSLQDDEISKGHETIGDKIG